MTILADHDVWVAMLDVLSTEGHDVVTAVDLGLSQAPDRTLLEAADARNRLLVTRDRDFGRLVFVGEYRAGVVFLRIRPATQEAVHEELRHVLTNNTFDELRHAFTVVEPGQHRIRQAS